MQGRGWRGGAAALAPLLCALLLCACATTPRPGAAPLAWAQRLTALQAIGQFQLQGRLAASTGTEGFSAGLRWRQQDDHASIDLSAPLGFGAAHIEQTARDLQLTTSKGQVLDSAAAADELRATLGFEPPLSSLRFWILGASDPESGAQESVDTEQRLAHLEQGGWQVDYGDYVLVQQQWLPRRLSVTRGSLRLRIVIDSWQL
ncbi:MAG TPA: lipoprotein insertase outer membrane protein LolB [Steroidobacteraceae bacterium]|jgi:outer membrane lipoprotein LolB|nr:lipoprotein insertase outer membrane protein LolB [Steroidobacteraceae bacterium]